MIDCLHCGAETTNGLALCDLSMRRATTCLEFLPVYYRNLARWKPGRAGSRPVPGSRVLYQGERDADDTGDRISDRLDETLTALTTWARVLVDSRPGLIAPTSGDDDAATVAALCSWLTEHLVSIATTDWCGQMVTEVTQHEETLRSFTETLVPGWYAGGCKRCDSGLYVVPGLTWVTCGSCGVVSHASDHLDTILEEARGWAARPKALAETLVALLQSEQSVPRLYERIKKWGLRERITAVRTLDSDGDPIGAKRYLLGEVLDRLQQEGETRTGDSMTAAS